MDIFIYFTLLVCLCVCEIERTNQFIRFVWYRPTVSVCSCMFIYLMCSCLYLHSVGESQLSLAKSRAFPDFVWRRACHVTGTESLVAGVNKPLGESSVVWGPVAARSCWRLGWHQSSDDARRQTVVHVQTQQSTRPPCCSVVKEDLV